MLTLLVTTHEFKFFCQRKTDLKKECHHWEYCTFPRRNKVFRSFKAMFLHPASPLGVQTVVEGACPELTPSLKVPPRNLQLIQQGWTNTCALEKQDNLKITNPRITQP